MKKSITLSQACDGVVRYKSATGLSPNTIRSYRTTFAKLKAYFENHQGEVMLQPTTSAGS